MVVDKYSSLYKSNGLTEIVEFSPTVYARDLLADAIKDGRLDDSAPATLISIPDALEIGGKLSAGEETSSYYYLKGTIKDTPTSTYGNFYLVDEFGNEIYVYGLYDASGNKYAYMQNPPDKGDTIIVYAKIKNYRNYYEQKIELISAVLIETE